MSDHPAHTNIPEPHAPESPTRGRKMFWIKLLSAMALILLGVFVMYRIVAYRALNQRIQAVRDAGYPIEPDEFNAWYAVPEDENAAEAYQRAFAAFPLDPESEGVPIVSTVRNYEPGQPLDKDMAKRIEDYLALHTEAIALLEEAALIEGCRYTDDLREGINLLLPQLGPLRRSARTLQLQSILDAHQGNYNLAAERCITILALARSLEEEPILISSLVRISIQALAINQIEILVTSGRVSDKQLQALSKALERIDQDRLMLRAMVGERCFIHGYFSDSETLAGTFPIGGPAGRLTVAVWRTSGLLDIDHSSSLDIMQDYVEFAENPTWPVPAKLEDIDDRVPRICVVTRQMIPAINSAFKASLQNDAKRRTVLAGIAAERYRQKHGTFPTQLTDLVPEFLDAVPLDPFDGQPLRYRIEDAGVIIYSLGADGIDNKGRQYDDVGSDYQEDTDITFTFGGLQELLWPLPEEEEIDWDDPYGGGYGGYGDPFEGDPPIEEENGEETETKDEVDTNEVEAETITKPPTE